MSWECSGRPVRLARALATISLAAPQSRQPPRAVCAETFCDSCEPSIAVPPSLAEPSSSFLLNCPLFIEFQHRAGLSRLQGSHEPALLTRFGTLRRAVWKGPSRRDKGSVAQGNRLRNQMLCPRRAVRHSPGWARRHGSQNQIKLQLCTPGSPN